MLPKTIASVGHACWQAVTISPSRISAVLLVGLDLRRADALHAVAALLHHAAAAHRHIRVAHQLQALGLVIGVEQEVEAPHLVGAVVRAVAGAHAAVVDHHVQAFRRVHRRAHRANLLAGSVLAVLAGHRLEVRPRSRQIALDSRCRCAATASCARSSPAACPPPQCCSPHSSSRCRRCSPRRSSCRSTCPTRCGRSDTTGTCSSSARAHPCPSPSCANSGSFLNSSSVA